MCDPALKDEQISARQRCGGWHTREAEQGQELKKGSMNVHDTFREQCPRKGDRSSRGQGGGTVRDETKIWKIWNIVLHY